MLWRKLGGAITDVTGFGLGGHALEMARGSDGRFSMSCGGDTFNTAIYLARAGICSRRNAEELMGRTECNRIVNFAGPARLIGQMVDVTITEAFPHSLRAEVLVRDSVTA